MIIDTAEQGSNEWFAARCGLPTASQFDNIVSSTGKKSTKWWTYLHKLTAERICGHSEPSYTNEWMERGIELEPHAIADYELFQEVEVKSVGLCYQNETKQAGFSPDGLIGDIGGLEIKCPSPGVHVGYLLGDKVPTKYKPQVYASLYLSGCKYWDFMSYHPEMKSLLKRTTTEDEGYRIYAKALDDYLPLFISDLNRATEKLK